GEAKGNALSRIDRLAVDVRWARGGAADVGHRGEHAEEFFAREGDQPWIGAQRLERTGFFGQKGDGAGDGIDDGVASAGEHDVGVAGDFLASEHSPLES